MRPASRYRSERNPADLAGSLVVPPPLGHFVTVERKSFVSTFNVLVVCTANHCRSPIAEQLLTAAVAEQFGDDNSWNISSAGSDVDRIRPLHKFAEEVLRERGVLIPGHRAVQVTRDQIMDADLILTAARQHRAAVVTIAPPALGRTFTIRQFARLVDQIEPITSTDPVELGRQLVDDAKFARGMMQPVPVEQDDVADPMGRPITVFRECADQLDDAVQRILRPLRLSAAVNG